MANDAKWIVEAVLKFEHSARSSAVHPVQSRASPVTSACHGREALQFASKDEANKILLLRYELESSSI